MYRYFVPIGQGGFAFEQFSSGETVVFDCGTGTKTGDCYIVEDRIKQFIPLEDKEIKIDKVFISHLHQDHITGLPYLIRNYKVGTIYLPYLTPSEQVICLILLSEEMNSRDMELFQNLITGKGLGNERRTNVTYVDPPGTNNIPGKDSGMANHIRSGQEVEGCETNGKSNPWIYIPFTYNDTQRTKKFMKILDDLDIKDDVINKILNKAFWKDETIQAKLKNAYEKTIHDINLTNMVVYSGTREEINHTGCCDPISMMYIGMEYIRQDGHAVAYAKNYDKYGCLYMGDYCAKKVRYWRNLKKAYDKVWNRIGVCTVPHHGSIDSFNPELADLEALFVINAGCNNQYKHPHPEVRKLLCDNCRNVFWTNEFDNSAAIFWINYDN